MATERRRVLVLDGDTNAARSVVQSLGRAGHDCWLATAGGRGAAFASRYHSRELEYPDPLFDPSGFVEWIGAAHGGRSFHHVLPLTETTLIPLHVALRPTPRFALGTPGEFAPRVTLLAKTVADLAPVVVLPPAAALETVLDGRTAEAIARSLGVPVPAGRYIPSGTIADEALPPAWSVVEPQYRTLWIEGRGTRLQSSIARDPRELRHALAGILPFTGAFVRERLPGKSVAITLLVRDGERILAFAQESLHELPGGRSTYRRSLEPPPLLLEAATAFFAHVKWTGAATARFRTDADTGRWALVGVSSDITDTLPLAQFAGIDFATVLVDLAAGRPLALRAPRHGTVWSRHFAGDLEWGRTARRGGASANAANGRPGMANLVGWARLFTGREAWDGASWRDPWPIVQEVTSTAARDGRSTLTRAIRGIRDRRRRRASHARLPKRQRVRRVLVLCYGNLCRSPYAGARLEAAARGLDLEIRTAGFSRHNGRIPPPFFQRLTAARGVDLGAHRSAHLDSKLLGWPDLIVLMDRSNERLLRSRDARRAQRAVLLGAFDPEGGADVRDPYELPVQEVVEVLAQIDRAVDGLVKSLGPPR